MKKIFSITGWLLIFLAVIISPGNAGKMRVAVLDFDASGITSDSRTGGRWWSQQEIGSGVTDMFTTALFKTGKFELVERNQLEKILAEQGLSQSGAVNPQTAVKMGRVLGVNALITGKVTQFGTREFEVGFGGFGGHQVEAKCAIDCRMVNTTTGAIMLAETAQASDSQVGVSVSSWHNLQIGGTGFDSTLIGQVSRKAISQLVDKIGLQAGKVEGKVAAILSDKIIINLGKNSGFVEGDVLEVFRRGEPILDPDTGEVLEQNETKIGEIKITAIKTNSSEATVVSSSAEFKIKDLVRPKPVVKAKTEKTSR